MLNTYGLLILPCLIASSSILTTSSIKIKILNKYLGYQNVMLYIRLLKCVLIENLGNNMAAKKKVAYITPPKQCFV
jgi:hypothetical protein